MQTVISIAADFMADAVRYLQMVKDIVVAYLGDLPVAGDFVIKAPLWIYGVVTGVFALSASFTIFEIITRLKNKAVDRVQGSQLGVIREKKRIMSEAARFARKQNPGRAAELYLSVDEVALAAETLEYGGIPAKAGQLYERLGRLDKAVSLYEKAGEFGWLAEALKKKGDHGRAADIFNKTGKKMLAAESYEKAGIFVKAGELFEEAGHTLTAAVNYEKGGDFARAAQLYDRAYVEGVSSKEITSPDQTRKLGEYSFKAGEYYVKAGEHERAVEAFARCKAYVKAGEAALLAGKRGKAAECFAQGKEYEKAARLYSEEGNTRRAAEVMAEKYLAENDLRRAASMFMEAADYTKAAELFEEAGEFGMAGEAYSLANEHTLSAELFVRAGKDVKAAEAYKNAGDPRRAAEIYAGRGEMEKASALLEEAGDFSGAAQIYRDSGQTDKELSALQKVSPDEPSYGDSVRRLAGLFMERGSPALAAEKYLAAIGGADASASNIELYYGLGTACEADSRFVEALKAYQKVQLADLHYRDVDDRVKNCARHVSKTRMSVELPGEEGPDAAEMSKRYTVMEEVGRGGMGVVYKAKDNNLNRIIALKLLPKSISDNPMMIKRFQMEARSAAQLNHPNIVTLYDFQQAGGRSFITMEFVEGVTLKKFLGMVEKPTVGQAVKIIYQCCQGLDYAHKKGIIHRDIKPSNIMINRQNVVKIMDFGLAKIAGEETLSDAGTISGTVMYMSPEQLVGEKLDTTTDIYSLGLVFYELVTGTHPFAEGDAAYHQVHSRPRQPRESRPEIPIGLESVVLKCLEKDRSLRFSTARELALALRDLTLK